MSNALKNEAKDVIRNAFMEIGSVRCVARISGHSRNTVRKVLREDGLLSRSILPSTTVPVAEATKVEFRFLDDLLKKGEPNEDNIEFAAQLKRITGTLAKELGVQSVTDELRLEVAMYHFISFRKYYFMSLETGSKSYVGPYSKAHDKQAKATLAFVDASLKSFEAFNKIIRELEIKNGKRSPSYGRGNTFVGQQQVNIDVNG